MERRVLNGGSVLPSQLATPGEELILRLFCRVREAWERSCVPDVPAGEALRGLGPQGPAHHPRAAHGPGGDGFLSVP